MMTTETDDDTTMAEATMSLAVGTIDKIFGKGYAKNNPALVAAYLQIEALQYASFCVGSGLEAIAAALAEPEPPRLNS